MSRVENWEQHFRQRKPPLSDCVRGYGRHVRGIPGMSNLLDFGANQSAVDLADLADNLVAVNDYIHRTPIKTSQAGDLASSWSQWWIKTGDPDNYFFSIPIEVWDEARNRKHAFDRANAETREEKKVVEQVITTGMTSEAMRGQAERKDPVTGDFFVPPKPPLPPWVVPAAVTGVLVVVGVTVARKLLFPML